MIKQFTYLVAVICMTASTFAAGGPTTTYIPGPDEADSTIPFRFDRISTGPAGSFAGYTAPFASPNAPTAGTLVISIDSVGGSNFAANTAATGTPAATTLPTCVTTLWITGDATNMATVCGTTAGGAWQLPTPSNTTGGIVRFALKNSPNATCQWFQGSLPTTWTVSVEPGSADPKLGTGILDVALGAAPTAGVSLTTAPTTLGISVGNTVGITIPQSSTLLASNANNSVMAVIGRKSTLTTYPPVILSGNSTFAKALYNVCLKNSSYTATIAASSVIAGAGSDNSAIGTGAISVGGSSAGALGLTSALAIRALGAGSTPAITLVNSGNSATISGS